jgi:hypothetical protein
VWGGQSLPLRSGQACPPPLNLVVGFGGRHRLNAETTGFIRAKAKAKSKWKPKSNQNQSQSTSINIKVKAADKSVRPTHLFRIAVVVRVAGAA